MIVSFNKKEKKFLIDLSIDNSGSEDENPVDMVDSSVQNSTQNSAKKTSKIVLSSIKTSTKSSKIKKSGKLAINSAKLSRKLFKNSADCTKIIKHSSDIARSVSSKRSNFSKKPKKDQKVTF